MQPVENVSNTVDSLISQLNAGKKITEQIEKYKTAENAIDFQAFLHDFTALVARSDELKSTKNINFTFLCTLNIDDAQKKKACLLGMRLLFSGHHSSNPEQIETFLSQNETDFSWQQLACIFGLINDLPVAERDADLTRFIYDTIKSLNKKSHTLFGAVHSLNPDDRGHMLTICRKVIPQPQLAEALTLAPILQIFSTFPKESQTTNTLQMLCDLYKTIPSQFFSSAEHYDVLTALKQLFQNQRLPRLQLAMALVQNMPNPRQHLNTLKMLLKMDDKAQEDCVARFLPHIVQIENGYQRVAALAVFSTLPVEQRSEELWQKAVLLCAGCIEEYVDAIATALNKIASNARPHALECAVNQLLPSNPSLCCRAAMLYLPEKRWSSQLLIEIDTFLSPYSSTVGVAVIKLFELCAEEEQPFKAIHQARALYAACHREKDFNRLFAFTEVICKVPFDQREKIVALILPFCASLSDDHIVTAISMLANIPEEERQESMVLALINLLKSKQEQDLDALTLAWKALPEEQRAPLLSLTAAWSIDSRNAATYGNQLLIAAQIPQKDLSQELFKQLRSILPTIWDPELMEELQQALKHIPETQRAHFIAKFSTLIDLTAFQERLNTTINNLCLEYIHAGAAIERRKIFSSLSLIPWQECTEQVITSMGILLASVPHEHHAVILEAVQQFPYSQIPGVINGIQFMLEKSEISANTIAMLLATQKKLGIPKDREEEDFQKKVFEALFAGLRHPRQASSIYQSLQQISSEQQKPFLKMALPLIVDIQDGYHRALILEAIGKLFQENRENEVAAKSTELLAISNGALRAAHLYVSSSAGASRQVVVDRLRLPIESSYQNALSAEQLFLKDLVISEMNIAQAYQLAKSEGEPGEFLLVQQHPHAPLALIFKKFPHDCLDSEDIAIIFLQSELSTHTLQQMMHQLACIPWHWSHETEHMPFSLVRPLPCTCYSTPQIQAMQTALRLIQVPIFLLALEKVQIGLFDFQILRNSLQPYQLISNVYPQGLDMGDILLCVDTLKTDPSAHDKKKHITLLALHQIIMLAHIFGLEGMLPLSCPELIKMDKISLEGYAPELAFNTITAALHAYLEEYKEFVDPHDLKLIKEIWGNAESYSKVLPEANAQWRSAKILGDLDDKHIAMWCSGWHGHFTNTTLFRFNPQITWQIYTNKGERPQEKLEDSTSDQRIYSTSRPLTEGDISPLLLTRESMASKHRTESMQKVEKKDPAVWSLLGINPHVGQKVGNCSMANTRVALQAIAMGCSVLRQLKGNPSLSQAECLANAQPYAHQLLKGFEMFQRRQSLEIFLSFIEQGSKSGLLPENYMYIILKLGEKLCSPLSSAKKKRMEAADMLEIATKKLDPYKADSQDKSGARREAEKIEDLLFDFVSHCPFSLGDCTNFAIGQTEAEKALKKLTAGAFAIYSPQVKGKEPQEISVAIRQGDDEKIMILGPLEAKPDGSYFYVPGNSYLRTLADLMQYELLKGRLFLPVFVAP